MPLVSFERSFKQLSKPYEFHQHPFKNGGTVISQSTVKIKFWGDWTFQLCWLIAPERLMLVKYNWSHLKDLLKSFQKLLNFIQICPKLAVQWSPKVQWKSNSIPLEMVQNGFPSGYFWFCIHYWWEQAKKMILKFFGWKGGRCLSQIIGSWVVQKAVFGGFTQFSIHF